jgi:hypothetical protein
MRKDRPDEDRYRAEHRAALGRRRAVNRKARLVNSDRVHLDEGLSNDLAITINTTPSDFARVSARHHLPHRSFPHRMKNSPAPGRGCARDEA